MPRSGRGGKRQGKPGTAYANRSDLTQAPSSAPGQTYGLQAQQLRAQQQVPLPQQAPPPPAAAGSAPAGSSPPAGAAPAVEPGSLGALNAPSARPNEPLTAGMNSGPGAGPEAIGNPEDPTLYQLKGILSRYPNPDLQALITEKESRG